MAEPMTTRYTLRPPGNGYAPASAAVGVVGFCLPLVGVVAVVLGVMGLVRSRRTFTGKGLAMAGIILGVLSVLLHVLIWMLFHRGSGAA